ncbi:MAG: LLM class flavin-dependent oxidoreductase [Gammaproteobacteria bacterium]|nr:LLM class flavin-dependent oxidoreductase [Gammaproteobacteria bacterium]
MQFWNFLRPSLGDIEAQAVRAEAQGWDGITLTDSQNLAADTYVALTLAARATTRLLVGPGVTNPLTRHAAVTAGAIASIHALSGQRAVLGIGRGDSALFNIGHKPVKPADFERYLHDVQRYLAGETIDKNGYPSRLQWLAQGAVGKVPMEVSATGPKVIAIAARHAERVTFALGADPERARWAIAELERNVPKGRPRPSPGLYVNVCVSDDPKRGAELIRGMVGTFAHFSSLPRASTVPTSEADASIFADIDKGYEKAKHGRPDSAHAQAMPADFIERFAVVGDAEHVYRKLKALLNTGIERLNIIGPRIDHFGEEAETAHARFASEVIPALRG